jgi:hypothetical protein
VGDINTIAITANKPSGGNCFSILPIKMLSLTGACDKQNVVLKWSTTTEANNNYFTVERSVEGKSWQVVGTVKGAGTSSFRQSYSLTDKLAGKAVSYYYRLKQTDYNGNYKHGNVVSIKKCGGGATENVTIYPNPSTGKFELLFTGDKAQVNSTQVFNSRGEKVYESTGFPSKFDLSGKAPGVYFVRIYLYSKTINQQILVKK